MGKLFYFTNFHFCDFRFFRWPQGICGDSLSHWRWNPEPYSVTMLQNCIRPASYDLCRIKNRKSGIVRTRVYEIADLHKFEFVEILHKIGGDVFCNRKLRKSNISSSIFFSQLGMTHAHIRAAAFLINPPQNYLAPLQIQTTNLYFRGDLHEIRIYGEALRRAILCRTSFEKRVFKRALV